MANNQERSPSIFLRVFFVLLILGVGIGGFAGLKRLKQPPRQVSKQEKALAVEVVEVQPADYRVTLEGYGELQPVTSVVLSTEVAGRIITTYEPLETGRLIEEGAVLFTLDQREYAIAYDTALARLEVLRRDFVLATKEFDRLGGLYREKNVGTLPIVEQAERAVNTIANQIRQVERDRDLAALQRERCIIRAPFPCRVVEVMVEQGEYVAGGKQLVTIVDDRSLEIEIALDSREAAKWLEFAPAGQPGPVNWFGQLQPVACRIHWTESSESLAGSGTLDRVVRFEPTTRSLVVAVKLDPETNQSFPLVAGMFCRVEVPAKMLKNVCQLPRQAVTQEQSVYRVVESRLRSTPVTVVRMAGPNAYIAAGLRPGDTVVTTRLVDPLEHTLIQVSARE